MTDLYQVGDSVTTISTASVCCMFKLLNLWYFNTLLLKIAH